MLDRDSPEFVHEVRSELERNRIVALLIDQPIFGQGIVRIVSGIKGGNVPQSNVDFGLKDTDVIKFTFNDEAARPIPQDLRTHLEEVQAKIIAGEIRTRAQ